ncbi:MAG: hypothetical protein PHT69_08590 [Bacteroidales bacterium]|nr:hypothetical protein [Bacteroidales bacterium]
MGKYKKHTLRLKGYETENGKIPFSLLKGLGDQLTRLAESTLLSFFEGNSTIKRGKTPEWLSNSIEFNLTGIRKGSTVLEIEAPLLSNCIDNFQLPFFSEYETDKLPASSALDLSFYVYGLASKNLQDSYLLDKNLLKEITKLKKILSSDKAEIIFESENDIYEITKDTLSEIKILEEKTPPSINAKIVGKLDVLQYSKSQLEILTDNKKIRALLSNELSFNDIFPFFGQDVSITGIANFNPAGAVSSFEIKEIKKADKKDNFFRGVPQPLFKEFDIQRLVEKKQYRGTNFENLIGKWPGDETTDQLLEMLK